MFLHPRAGAILLPTSKLSKVQFDDKVHMPVMYNEFCSFCCHFVLNLSSFTITVNVSVTITVIVTVTVTYFPAFQDSDCQARHL